MQYIPTFLDAARRGAEILNRYFGEMLVTTQKTTAADFQTKADLESEAAILPVLEKAFPDFDIHSEENGHKHKKSEYTIVVDPLDGTNNFVSGIPNFTILIALLYRKEAIAGLIYNPITQAACYAEKGKGAFLNGAKIHVSAESDPSRSAIAYVPGYKNAPSQTPIVMAAMHNDLHIKRFHYNWSGATDAIMIASGRIEAMLYDGNEIYDYAPGKIICREAGAKITDLSGAPILDDTGNFFLISNGTSLHEQILASWQKVRKA